MELSVLDSDGTQTRWSREMRSRFVVDEDW